MGHGNRYTQRLLQAGWARRNRPRPGAHAGFNLSTHPRRSGQSADHRLRSCAPVWCGWRTCAGRARVSRRSARASPRGSPPRVASVAWRRGSTRSSTRARSAAGSRPGGDAARAGPAVRLRPWRQPVRAWRQRHPVRRQLRGGRRGAAAAAAKAGGDRLFGGAGNDRLFAGAGSDRLDGGPGRDLLQGGPGRDLLRGGAGPDRLDARDGRRETVVCGAGPDIVRADARDRLVGCERISRG